MRRRDISYFAAVAAGLCTVIALSTNWALASGDCVVQPNRELAQGGHWYYRVDHVNYRKCWYLAEPTTRMSNADAPEARSSSDSATIFSFFSLLSADFMGAKPAGVQQDAMNSGARALQAHPNDLASRAKRSRIARHSVSNTALNETLNRQSPARPRVEDVNQPPPLGQTERDVLFQEFLKWNAKQAP
jgi:hypothetical protein